MRRTYAIAGVLGSVIGLAVWFITVITRPLPYALGIADDLVMREAISQADLDVMIAMDKKIDGLQRQSFFYYKAYCLLTRKAIRAGVPQDEEDPLFSLDPETAYIECMRLGPEDPGARHAGLRD